MNRSTARAAANTAVVDLQSERLELPLLREALGQLEQRRSHLLDFGALQQPLIDALRPQQGRLQVVNLGTDGGEQKQQRWLTTIEQVIPSFQHQRCDCVLTWDTLNYLTAENLNQLNSILGQIAAPAMRLHALIRYSKPEMPIAPDQYLLTEERTVERRARTAESMQAPRYSPKALEKHMPAFRVDRTRLLGNGMQEFILRFEPETEPINP